MKKTILLGASLLAVAGMSAQTSLVKEVERNMKANKSEYVKNLNTLRPAFNNPETAQAAFTYFVAGKGGYDYFDDGQVMIQLGKDANKKEIGQAMVDAYGFMMKAMSLDSLPDAKGKVKPKYSKDAIKSIVGHYNDFQSAAVLMWEAEDYAGAVNAWQLYLDAAENPTLVANGLAVQPDTIYGEILYNMGIGNSLAQNNEGALQNFKDAISKGYTKKNAYDYGISAASALNRPDEMSLLAQQAYPLYGKEDDRYIGYIVNALIQKKDYAKAESLINEYLAKEPNNSQLYFVKGVLLESEEKMPEALEAYKKAVALDPQNGSAQFRAGYMVYQEALTLDQEEGGKFTSNAEYNKFADERITPLLKQAAEYCEKALAIDPENSDAKSVLRSVYYSLKDETNLKRIEDMM